MRAAVVLLHAATEDLLRSLAYWKLPLASGDVLSKIPLIATGPNAKFSLGDLSIHRGKDVDSVIAESVNGYLERSNYNNTDEVASLLTSIGVTVTEVNGHFSQLSEVMSRRHLIVHRADRSEAGGRGNHSVSSIGPKTVSAWVSGVESFGIAVLNNIPE